jgi:ribosomal-protein-alanine N-acetyltransferase
VAETDAGVAGFLVTRAVASDEVEILNLAVAPALRRRGIARSLLSLLVENVCGAVFLEVRESNSTARDFYHSIGFKEVGRRPDYYTEPCEASIVMKFHSC